MHYHDAHDYTGFAPLHVWDDGTIRVGSSRLTIDFLVEAFSAGMSPEEFVRVYPTITLAEAYGAIGYYLSHRTELDAYIAEGKGRAEALRQEIESQPGYREWRDSLKEKLVQRARERGLRP